MIRSVSGVIRTKTDYEMLLGTSWGRREKTQKADKDNHRIFHYFLIQRHRIFANAPHFDGWAR